MKKHIILLSAIFGLAYPANRLSAITFTESTDAGTSETTAVLLPRNVDRVIGTLKSGTTGPFTATETDIDVYAFTIKTTTIAIIEAKAAAPTDMNLLLLGEDFFGIEGDDDDGALGNDSLIAITLAPGTYYVAVGLNNIGAYPFTATMAGQDTWDNDSGLLIPPASTTPISFIASESANPDDTTGQPYEITFNFATSVTGLDLSAGKTFATLRGEGIVNTSGAGQLAKIKGSGEVSFRFRLNNIGDDRKVRARLLGAARNFPLDIFELRGGRVNVTSAVKTGTYQRNMISGTRRSFTAILEAPENRRSLVRIRVSDANRPSVKDVAGVLVTN